MTDIVFQQILDGLGFCHEHGIVPASDDECCPYCGATAHGVEMTRLAKETLAEIERLNNKLNQDSQHFQILYQKAEIERLTEALVYATSMPLTETLRALGVTEGIIESMQQEWLSKAPSHYASTLRAALAGKATPAAAPGE
jgi:DNA repair exonuclease SbcCD ATPase subunit